MNTNKTVSKGNANKDTLGDRMKRYEAVTTSTSLIERLPVYARIDGRAFHTFTRGMDKPFDFNMVDVMQKTCAKLVDTMHAKIGYVQSDEISLCWEDTSKVPFETRLFKLESVLAAAATSYFTVFGMDAFKDRILKFYPHFDCRVCQLPDMTEVANMFLFRELDCLKNSITMVAHSLFSDKELHKKNSDDKIRMMRDYRGVDYHNDVAEHLRYGSYFHRELYHKMLTSEEYEKTPKSKLLLDENGMPYAIRSHVVQFRLGKPLVEIDDKKVALFGKE